MGELHLDIMIDRLIDLKKADACVHKIINDFNFDLIKEYYLEIKNDNKVIKTDSMMEVIGNVLVIHISGELDHHNSVEIRNNADEIICKRRIIHILFDFEKTDFMDSSGIGVIMGRYKKVKDFGGSMGAVNTKNNIDKILLYSGLNKIVKHYDSIESAIEEMKGGNQIG